MKPLTDVAVTSLYERSEVVEEGHTLFQLNARFPLEWQLKHFEQKPKYYAVKPKDLNVEDQFSYEKLVAYVRSFTSKRCMEVDNNFLFDDNRENILVNRLINTKALLECSSDEEALRLLGRGHAREFIFVCLPYN